MLFIVVVMWKFVASTNDQSVDGCIKDPQNHYTTLVSIPELTIDISIVKGWLSNIARWWRGVSDLIDACLCASWTDPTLRLYHPNSAAIFISEFAEKDGEKIEQPANQQITEGQGIQP